MRSESSFPSMDAEHFPPWFSTTWWSYWKTHQCSTLSGPGFPYWGQHIWNCWNISNYLSLDDLGGYCQMDHWCIFSVACFLGSTNIYGIVGIYQIISGWMTLEVTVRPLMHFPPFTSRIWNFSLNMALWDVCSISLLRSLYTVKVALYFWSCSILSCMEFSRCFNICLKLKALASIE